MLLNVLLVDDEYLVLKGLEIILKEQTEVSLNLITAMDATDALEKTLVFHPDVVIADINMPEVNGFELIHKLHMQFPCCRFIICSGYDTHDYLKQALQLHVTDYLLKPIDKTLLINRLKELSIEKENRFSHTILRIQLLLLCGKNSSDIDFSEKELEQLFPNCAFCLLAVNTQDIHSDEIQKLFAQYFDTLYVFTLNSRTIYLLNYPDKIRTDEIRSIIAHILHDIIWGCSFFTATEEKTTAIRTIPLHYQTALCEMVLSLLPETPDIKKSVLQKSIHRTLFPAIRVITFEDNVEDYIQNLYGSTDSEICYPLTFTEIFSAYIFISDINIPTDLILQLYSSHADTLCTKKNLIQFVKKNLHFWYDSFSHHEHVNYSSKINTARHYIDTHYQEDVSLDQLAEVLTVNSSYLSYLFKKETGSTFIQYLNTIRMQQACHLLKTQPELSLDEITLAVGYHSTTYFHKIFREQFGVSPRQWQVINKNI